MYAKRPKKRPVHGIVKKAHGFAMSDGTKVLNPPKSIKRPLSSIAEYRSAFSSFCASIQPYLTMTTAAKAASSGSERKAKELGDIS